MKRRRLSFKSGSNLSEPFFLRVETDKKSQNRLSFSQMSKTLSLKFFRGCRPVIARNKDTLSRFLQRLAKETKTESWLVNPSNSSSKNFLFTQKFLRKARLSVKQLPKTFSTKKKLFKARQKTFKDRALQRLRNTFNVRITTSTTTLTNKMKKKLTQYASSTNKPQSGTKSQMLGEVNLDLS